MPDTRRQDFDEQGLNSAVDPAALTESALTPTDRFFTRSHAAYPVIDPATWRLAVDGLVGEATSFSMDELAARFARHDVDATLMCAGLRRKELLAVKPMPGELPWGSEPVSTGRWSGYRLMDILAVAKPRDGAEYVEFTGLDQVERDGRTFGFGGSIDLAKAMTPDVLLATHLNDAPLPLRHGFPMRALVPGWYGARSVKWLGQVTLRSTPSENYFQTSAYRVQRAIVNGDPRDVRGGVPLAELPLNSVIAEPADGGTVKPGSVAVRGWAIGQAGAALRTVSVSTDNGTTWQAMTVERAVGEWTWSLWHGTVKLAAGDHQLLVRATDAAGSVQPESLAASWNVKGYSNSSYQRVRVTAR